MIDSPSPADESAQSVADGFGTFIRKARIDRTSLIRSGGAQGAADASDLRDAPAGISAAAESTRAKFPALGIESIRGAPSPKSIAAYAPVNPGPGLAAGGAVLVPASRAQAQRPASLAGRLTGWFRGNGASGELETGSKGVRATNVPGLGGGGELERSVYSKGATLDLMGVPGGGPETRLSQLRQGETLTLKGETKDGWVKVQTQRLSELNKSTGKWEPTEGWVKKEAVSDDAGLASLLQSPPANQTRQAFVDAVKRYEGTPYRYGGTSPGRDGGVDCSGLVVAGLTDTGFNRIPRTAADQQRASARIDASQLKPGDLVFDGDPAHHVIIVIDGGQAIEAPQTGMTVSRSSLSQRISSMRDPHPASLLP
ncbi:MAG: C40 family peptidase [Elusimicrobia bacterium]|nr:C40 family peptidase [Elusimicrobiota bacterium]